MKDKRTLHFTLGPVQGFIAQARRTRDLWAGSFILSYLAGHAMCAVIKAEGEIDFPAVTQNDEIKDNLLRAISSQGKSLDVFPHVGTLPNRFKAQTPLSFAPGDCSRAVQEAWERIARAVWDGYVAPVAEQGKGTEEIWQSQVKNYWEINWTVGAETNSLDRRKNWRSYVPPVEHGDKCNLMGNLQEISGFTRTQNRKKQDKFWSLIREKAGEMNIKEGERLSAISLIKRLFPTVAEKAIGWRVPKSYPSTSYIAAVPWLLEILKDKSKEETVDKFLLAAKQGSLKNRIGMERDTGLRKIEEAKKAYPRVAGLAECDANFFYASTLANDNLWPEGSENERKELQSRLKDFSSESSTFYAVLAMDGDRMGALLRQAGEAEVSEALAHFTDKVPTTVDEFSGSLIYAGGDDVLALVPAQNAVALAAELRREYSVAFESTGVPKYQSTISAGLVYAHHHAPLKAVLKETHRLLDEVAKNKTGRDSLAVRVWNTGGPSLSWSAPWEVLCREETNLLDALVKDFIGDSGEKQYNSVFFYNLRHRLSLLWGKGPEQRIDQLSLTDLFVAEYLRSRGRENMDHDIACTRMEQLLEVCRLYYRVDSGKEEKPKIVQQGISTDGAMLVRFLAERGIARERQTMEI